MTLAGSYITEVMLLEIFNC